MSGVREMFLAADMEFGEVNNAVHDFILVLGKTHAQITVSELGASRTNPTEGAVTQCESLM